MQIVVFGGGMQGRVIAKNLADRKESPEVVVADIQEPSHLPAGVRYAPGNVLDETSVTALLKGADAAVLAVPSHIAHDALSNILKSGVAVVDVSFTPDPPLDLDSLAKSTGSSCVVDCGVAPGLSHMLVGCAYAELGGLDEVLILVGGMPQNPPQVFRHAVYFNPSDLISEYVRPARAREQGKEIAPAPLSVPIDTYMDPEVGPLEAFLSDGLRSLLTSFPDIPNMWERTLRWSGHLDTMRSLGEMGLFENSALPATAAALGARYAADKHPDFLLMVVEASRNGEKKVWRLLDRHTQGQSAMSRTTGYTTAAVAMVLARRQFNKPGVHPPEELGKQPALARAVVDDLAERGIVAEARHMESQKA